MKNKPPKEMRIVMFVDIVTSDYDDDVDWSDPTKVILDEIIYAGLTDTIGRQEINILSIGPKIINETKS